MIFKTFIVYLIIQLVAASASLEEISDAAAVEQHERAPIPGALVPLPEMAASTKGVHLSVTTGTPGVWYPGTGAPFNPQSLLNYWTASDSSGQFPSAASENGTVYISDDYGVTWSARGVSRAYTSIASDASGNRLAVTVNNEGVYLSSDRGTTWTLANVTAASNNLWTDVSSDYSGQYLTAVGALSQYSSGIIVYSHDFGVTWTTAASHSCYYYDTLPTISMNHDGQYQYALFSYCSLRSTDYGVTWTQMSTTLRTVASNGNGQRLAATANYDGSRIMGSTDFGVTWTQFNHPTGDSNNWVTYSSIVMDTSGLNIVVGGFSLKAVIASADGGATWSYITPKGGLFASTFPHRMVGDAAAKHLLIAQGLKTTVNPLVTASLPESVPTAKPTAQPVAGMSNSTIKSFASVNDTQFFLVPARVTTIKVTLYAASGGNYTTPGNTNRVGTPGNGGMITSLVPVTPGEVLMVMVGSVGTYEESTYNGVGGFNGGGHGNGPGGGATDIRRSPYTLADRVLIAGAGGGGGWHVDSLGGHGGLNPTGGIPGDANYLVTNFAPPGGNRLQEPMCTNKNAGPLGQGCDSPHGYTGGGGGGYYGGSSVGWSGGGGGGSSYSLYSVVDEASGVNTGDGYAVLEYQPDLLESPSVSPSTAPSLLPVPSPTAQSGVCPNGTILLSNSCVVCPAGTYAASGFEQCMPCPAGTYSGAWSTTCTVSPAGFYSLEGAAQAIMCPAGTVSNVGASSCTACPAGQYSYPGTSTCLTCAASA